MLIALTTSAFLAPSPCSRRAGSPQMMADREKLKQLFGDDFQNAEERELARVTAVDQPDSTR